MCYFEKKEFKQCKFLKIMRFSKSRGFQNHGVFKITGFSKLRGFQNRVVLKITGFSKSRGFPYMTYVCMLENTDRLLNSCKTVFKYIVIGFINPLRHFPRARTWIALRGLGGGGYYDSYTGLALI